MFYNKFAFFFLFSLLIINTGCGSFYHKKPSSIKILALNDFHGNLTPPPIDPNSSIKIPLGGVEALDPLVKSIKKENPHTILVSAGDNIGSSPLLSAAFNDEPSIEALNLIGLELSVVGNHEFDHGIEELLRIQNGGCHKSKGCNKMGPFKGASFKYLAANVIKNEDNKSLFPAYKIKYINKIPVAFVGVVTKSVKSLVAPKLDEVEFIDEALAVNKLIPELKAKGSKAIIVLIHEGGDIKGHNKNVLKDKEQINRCENLSGAIMPILDNLSKEVDVVITGHTHLVYNCNIKGRLVTSALSFGRLLTEIDLFFDAKKNLIEKKATNRMVKADKKYENEQTKLIKKASHLINSKGNEIIGYAHSFLNNKPNKAGESLLGDIIADSQLEATKAAGAQIAFVNSNGIRQSIIPDEKGAITYGKLYAAQSHSNDLIIISLKGKEIKELLEQQWIGPEGKERSPKFLQVSKGFSYMWDGTKPLGDRVDANHIKLDGKIIDLEKSYRITINDFLIKGGDDFTLFKKGTNPFKTIKNIEATEAYLRKNNPIELNETLRIIRIK